MEELINALIHWAIYQVDWRVWAGIGVILVLFAYLLKRLIGWQGILAIIIGAAAATALVRARQKGYRQAESDARDAADNVLDKAHDARAEQEKKNEDPDRLYDDDGHRRD